VSSWAGRELTEQAYEALGEENPEPAKEKI